MQKKKIKLDQAFINDVEKCQTACLNLEIYRYDMLYNVNTLFASLSSQNIENQQIKSTKCTVLMLGIRQNER